MAALVSAGVHDESGRARVGRPAFADFEIIISTPGAFREIFPRRVNRMPHDSSA